MIKADEKTHNFLSACTEHIRESLEQMYLKRPKDLREDFLNAFEINVLMKALSMEAILCAVSLEKSEKAIKDFLHDTYLTAAEMCQDQYNFMKETGQLEKCKEK